MPFTSLEVLRPCTFDQLATNFLIPMTPSALTISWKHSQNSGKCYTQVFSFIVKGTNQAQPNKESYRVAWGSLNTEVLPYPLPVGREHPPGISENITGLQYPEFLLGLYYVAWLINHCPCDWTQSLALFPHVKVELAQSPNALLT